MKHFFLLFSILLCFLTSKTDAQNFTKPKNTSANVLDTTYLFDPPYFYEDDGSKIEIENIVSIEAHKGSASALAVSADGTLIATGGDDNSVKLWSGTEALKTLKEHDAPVTALDFSPDGNFLASCGKDNKIVIWNLNTFKEVLIINNVHSKTVNDIKFTKDGAKLISCGDNCFIKIWNLETKFDKTLKGHVGFINTLTLSPDGNFLISSGSDRQFIVWNLLNGGSAKYEREHSDPIKSVLFNNKGNAVVSCSQQGKTILWNWSDMKMEKKSEKAVIHSQNTCMAIFNKIVLISGTLSNFTAINFDEMSQKNLLFSKSKEIAMNTKTVDNKQYVITNKGFLFIITYKLPIIHYSPFAILNSNHADVSVAIQAKKFLFSTITNRINELAQQKTFKRKNCDLSDIQPVIDSLLSIYSSSESELEQLNYYQLLFKTIKIISERKFFQYQSVHNELLKIDSKQFSALRLQLLAQLCLGENKLLDAKNYIKQAIELDKSNTVFSYVLGEIYFEMKLYKDALTAYNEALTLEPQSKEIIHKIANTYREMSSFVKAEEYYRKMFSKSVSNSDYYCDYADLQLRRNRLKDAESLLYENLPDSIINTNILINRGLYKEKLVKKYLRDVEQMKYAAANYIKSIQADENEFSSYYELSRFCIEYILYNYEKEIQSFDLKDDTYKTLKTKAVELNVRALKMNPYSIEAKIDSIVLANLENFIQTKNIQNVELFDNAQNNISNACFKWANYFEIIGNHKIACKYFEQTIKNDSANIDAYFCLFEIYEHSNLQKESKNLLQNANSTLKLTPFANVFNQLYSANKQDYATKISKIDNQFILPFFTKPFTFSSKNEVIYDISFCQKYTLSLSQLTKKLMKVEYESLYGAINNMGKVIVPLQYNDIEPVNDTLIIGYKRFSQSKRNGVNLDNEYVYSRYYGSDYKQVMYIINHKNEVFAEFRYDKSFPLISGKRIFKDDKTFYFINKAWNAAPIGEYDQVWGDEQNTVIVQKDGLYGCYQFEGEKLSSIVPVLFTQVTVHDFFIEVTQDGKVGAYNYNGKSYIPTKYMSIGVDYNSRLNKTFIRCWTDAEQKNYELYDENGKCEIGVGNHD